MERPKRGVLFLTIPEEHAQRVDYLAERFGATTEQVVTASIVTMEAFISRNDPYAITLLTRLGEQTR